MPAVSVIMAVHNEPECVLESAIESILFQTMSDFELIVCDDGSAKTTVNILRKWKEDDRVTVVRNEESKGASVARNRAMRLAKGRYVAIMDADDISEKHRLEKQYLFLEQNAEFGFVGCRGAFFEEVPGDQRECYWYVSRPEPQDFLMTLPFLHASIMFRREVFEGAGGYREIREVTRSEDYDLLLRLYAAGVRGANLPDTLYYYRVDSATLRKRKYRYRFNEAAVKLEGFSRLHLMPRGLAYAFKPLVVGLIPARLLAQIKQRYYDGTGDDPDNSSMTGEGR